ncbi:hypothetical protein BO86DRAFT_395277 [Aspergillus japonicus CBS 114.51]|uniref:C2H2-type domain-containing protein n=1 Tax=Aspergillus japonicus CBS 114.51 TaxID=1448312 RepID=A0A8T8XEU3_ASPJA|nr:hypothetical protein BO86DRAFT_395277 [Aspergillus japonicus CBS 114.51]RAH86655.1 hypothetical protein BO86DRAFT_395277 [Aspergillus japonicus CBS 114.51]
MSAEAAPRTITVAIPRNTQLIAQVLRCSKLHKAIPRSRSGPRDPLRWLELEGQFLTDYKSSCASKLRTLPMARLSVGYALANVEVALSQASPLDNGIWCDAAALAFEEAQAEAKHWIQFMLLTLRGGQRGRTYESAPFILTSPDYDVPDEIGDDRSADYRQQALRSLRTWYPDASHALHERLADAKLVRWRFLQWQRREAPGGTPRPQTDDHSSPGGNFPPPPALSPGAEEVQSPYCGDFIPAAICAPAPWRDHVLYDFHPYICLHEQCGVNAAFPTVAAWEAHMVKHDWRDLVDEKCPLCSTWLGPSAIAHLTVHLHDEIMGIRALPPYP